MLAALRTIQILVQAGKEEKVILQQQGKLIQPADLAVPFGLTTLPLPFRV